jgi:hypothetical protein
MERFPTKRAMEAAGRVETRCMYCGGDEGRIELLDTGDADSLDGFEVWFCCHACRDAGEPCETFHRLEAA